MEFSRLGLESNRKRKEGSVVCLARNESLNPLVSPSIFVLENQNCKHKTPQHRANLNLYTFIYILQRETGICVYSFIFVV